MGNMREKMDSVLMLIFVLSFASVKTKEQAEKSKEVSFPDAPLVFPLVEKFEDDPEKAENDAEMFWEVTQTPRGESPPDVVDGNHPDDGEITTHDHVDRTVGHVPPTKRVKKILPPFEGGKQRNARHIESSLQKDLKATAEGTTKSLGLKETIEPFDISERNVTETTVDSLTPPNEIKGIRLVPEESGVLPSEEETPREEDEGEEGEEGEEESTMQKSIWDLLKEREQFNLEATHLDATESSVNETEAATQHAMQKSKSLYEHFDADSAEVEFETEGFQKESNVEKHELPLSYAMPWLQAKAEDSEEAAEEEEGDEEIPQDVSKLLRLSQNEKSVNGVSVSIINGAVAEYGEASRYGRRPSKWCLLLLTGNSTIVKLRRKDFTKYLKLNLAARLSVEYDDVKVNKVILAPPKVLVNVSVFAPSDDVAEESQLDLRASEKGEAPLHRLAETNATLLELSGEEYHVIRFLSFETQKPEAEAHKDVPTTATVAARQSDLELVIYTFLGSACACAALLALFVSLNKYYKRVSDFGWLKPKPAAWRDREDEEFGGVSPAVIYSGGFPQIRGSWMSGRHPPPPLRRQRPLFPSPPVPEPPTRPLHRPQTPHQPPAPSPRHTKLQMFHHASKDHANSLLIPLPVRSPSRRGPGGDALDVRISGEAAGTDNPNFTN